MSEQAAPRVGRPRKFDAEVERDMILDAGLRVMARNGYLDASVGDVLEEVGLSTRSFYRHFATKSDLLLTLFRRDAEAVGRALHEAVQDRPDAREGLDAWLDGYLDLFFEPKRAARTALFSSPGVRAADGFADALAHAEELLAEPLVEVLRTGRRQRALRSPSPSVDARTILAVAASICAPTGVPGPAIDRAAARAHIQRFCWPALGIAPR